MTNNQKSYYYKEIEAAFTRFKEVGSKMLPYAETFKKILDVDVIRVIANFQRPIWSKHPSVINLNLLEDELTDDQKEEIALSNKVEFDAAIKELNEMSDLWESVAKKSNMVEQASITIIDMVLDSVKSRLTYDYHGELNGDYDAIPITLTAEELYWALDLIGTEQARLVLSEQSHQVFDALYNAYKKGKESFTRAFANLTSAPMKGLRTALMSFINDADSFMCFIETQLIRDKKLLAILADEMFGCGDGAFLDILNCLLCGETVRNLDTRELLTSYENEVGRAMTTAVNIGGLGRFEHKQVQKIKESLTNELPSIPTDQMEEINISPKLLNIITTLMDKWLVEKIHEYIRDKRPEITDNINPTIGESEFEATDRTLMRFFDNMLVFDGQKRIEFINKYLNHLTGFFIAIDNKIALYSFASLFYPIVLKLGRYSEDKVTAATRLSGGIQWKTYPESDNKVINLIIALNPTQFNKLKPCKEESLSPARRMDYLVKLASNQTSRYSWIKDFIEDYWPQVAREEFERKYRIKK